MVRMLFAANSMTKKDLELDWNSYRHESIINQLTDNQICHSSLNFICVWVRLRMIGYELRICWLPQAKFAPKSWHEKNIRCELFLLRLKRTKYSNWRTLEYTHQLRILCSRSCNRNIFAAILVVTTERRAKKKRNIVHSWFCLKCYRTSAGAHFTIGDAVLCSPFI